MAYLDNVTMMTLLDEQEAHFQQQYPVYKRLAGSTEQHHATSGTQSPSVSRDGLPDGGGGSSSAARQAGAAQVFKPTKLSSMISGLNDRQATQKSFLELSGDPQLFKLQLLPPGQPWNSLQAAKGAAIAEQLLFKLPNFSPDPARGCNALVIKGEALAIPGYDRVYAAVNVGQVTEGTDPAGALNKDVIAHVSFRVDPVKSGAGGVRNRYVQAYKSGGRWDDKRSANKVLVGEQWGPFQTSKVFWLRLVFDARGCFSYVNGKAFSYTPYPPSWQPLDKAPLVAQVPIAGDAGEKVTWRVHSMAWGSARLDDPGFKLFHDHIQTHGNQMVSVPAPAEMYITGLPAGAGDAHAEQLRLAVLQAFQRWDAVDARLGPTQGSATVILRDPTRTSQVIAATNMSLNIMGSTVIVQQGFKQVPAKDLLQEQFNVAVGQGAAGAGAGVASAGSGGAGAAMAMDPAAAGSVRSAASASPSGGNSGLTSMTPAMSPPVPTSPPM